MANDDPATPRIVVVDDEETIRRVIRRALELESWQVVTFEGGEEALIHLTTESYDVIVSDHHLPGIDGSTTIQRAKEIDPDIGAVIITGQSDDRMIIDAFTHSKVDAFLEKPFTLKEVASVVRLAHNAAVGRKLERAHKVELSNKIEAATQDLIVANKELKNKQREATRLNRQLTAEHERLTRLNERLKRLSITDEMTGLYNHRYFIDRISAEIDRVRRYGGDVSLLMFDIDDFKKLNDRHGHLAGDDALRALGELLIKSSRRIDVPARYGGEEFVIIAPSVPLSGATTNAERLRKAVAGLSVASKAGPMNLTVSIGVATYSGGSRYTPQRLVREADEALYHAKALGKNCVVAYEQSGLTALGKEGVVTTGIIDRIVADTASFIQSADRLDPVFRHLCKRISEEITNGGQPLAVTLWKKMDRTTVVAVESFGAVTDQIDDRGELARRAFSRGRRIVIEKDTRRWVGAPIRIGGTEGSSTKRQTVAAITFGPAPVNPEFIDELFEKLAHPLEIAAARQKINETIAQEKALRQFAEISRDIVIDLVTATTESARRPQRLLKGIITSLKRAPLITTVTAYVIEEGFLYPTDQLKNREEGIELGSEGKKGFLLRAAQLSAKEPLGFIDTVRGHKSEVDLREFAKYALSCPAILTVVTTRGDRWLFALDLAFRAEGVDAALLSLAKGIRAAIF